MRPNRRTLLAAIAGAALLAAVALQVLLPGWILQRYLHGVADLGRYTGTAGSAQLTMLPPGYRLSGVRFHLREGPDGADLLQADLQVRLHPLRGSSEVRVDALRMQLVDRGAAQASQLGEGIPWRRLLDALAPASLPVERVQLDDATLEIRLASAPDAPIVLAPLQARIEGLRRTPDARTPMPAQVQAAGRLLDHAPLSLRMHFDPDGPMQRMQARIEVADLALARLDPWADAWGGVDFEAGRAAVSLEFGSVESRLDGTLQLALVDVQVFDARRDLGRDRDGPLRAARELLAGAALQLRTRSGELRSQRPLQARFTVPEDNLEGLALALVEGLKSLEPD